MHGLPLLYFDGWSLQRDSGELCRDGVKLRLQEQALQFLLELLDRPGEVVTREQLIARLWPKTVVDFDTGLNSIARKLRIALSDAADTPRYIETVPRKGYRFIGELQVPPSALTEPQDCAALDALTTAPAIADEPPLAPRRPLRSWYVAVGVALLVAGLAWLLDLARTTPEAAHLQPVIAVLPLADMSGGQHDQLLGAGMSEEVANWLSQIHTLEVVRQPAHLAARRSQSGVLELGRILRASHVVTGSVRRSGSDLRVTVQLLRTTDGLQLWSKSFDFRSTDLLQIEDAVALNVANALQMRLNPHFSDVRTARLSKSRPAVELYFSARDHFSERTAQSNTRAIDLYQQAIQIDPTFALAHARLAEAYINEVDVNARPIEEMIPLADAAIARALSFNPRLPEALAAKGHLLTEQARFTEAEQLLRRVIDLDPNDAGSRKRLGKLLTNIGQPIPALAQFRRAAILEPFDFSTRFRQCFILQNLGHLEDAADQCAQARKLGSTNPWGYFATVQLMEAQGSLVEALDWIEKTRALDPQNLVFLSWQIELQLTLGMPAAARATLSRYGKAEQGKYSDAYARIVLAEQDPQRLHAYLDSITLASTSSLLELTEVAKLYHIAGNATKANQLIRQAAASQRFRESELFDPLYAATGGSDALTWAAILIDSGARSEGLLLLDRLDALLARLASNGVDRHGLHALQAESLALRGRGDAALAALTQAVQRGWLSVWRARREPYLQSLRERKDYQSLIAEADRKIASMRTRLRAATTS